MMILEASNREDVAVRNQTESVLECVMLENMTTITYYKNTKWNDRGTVRFSTT
jgi:hypothetical protein